MSDGKQGGNIYGQTSVGGSATVQLGDRYTSTSNVIHIATAYFGREERHNICYDVGGMIGGKRLRDEIEHDDDLQQTKRRREQDQDDMTCACGQSHPLARLENTNVLAGLQKCTVSSPSRSSEREPRENDNGAGHAPTTLDSALLCTAPRESMTASTPVSFVAGFANQLLCTHKQLMLRFNASCSDALRDAGTSAALSHKELVCYERTASREIDPLKEFIAVLITLSVSASKYPEILPLIDKDRPGRKVGALLTLLVYLFTRSVLIPMISKGLSELTGDFITIEDACAQRWRVPMSHCQSFGMLKAFLEYRHQDRPGLDFVRSGQFNLMLGSRRGLLVQRDDWNRKGIIRPGALVVMSVYINVDEARCTMCAGALFVNTMGEFHCAECGLFFRDLHTLRPFNSPRNPQYGSDKQSEPQPLPWDEAHTESPFEELDDTDVWGLKYVDLRIVPLRNYEDSTFMDADSPIPANDTTTGMPFAEDRAGNNSRNPDITNSNTSELTEETHTAVARETELIRRQQSQINQMLRQVQREHDDLLKQATSYTSVSSTQTRHNESINAILKFLAEVYNRSLTKYDIQDGS